MIDYSRFRKEKNYDEGVIKACSALSVGEDSLGTLEQIRLNYLII